MSTCSKDLTSNLPPYFNATLAVPFTAMRKGRPLVIGTVKVVSRNVKLLEYSAS